MEIYIDVFFFLIWPDRSQKKKKKLKPKKLPTFLQSTTLTHTHSIPILAKSSRSTSKISRKNQAKASIANAYISIDDNDNSS